MLFCSNEYWFVLRRVALLERGAAGGMHEPERVELRHARDVDRAPRAPLRARREALHVARRRRCPWRCRRSSRSTAPGPPPPCRSRSADPSLLAKAEPKLGGFVVVLLKPRAECSRGLEEVRLGHSSRDAPHSRRTSGSRSRRRCLSRKRATFSGAICCKAQMAAPRTSGSGSSSSAVAVFSQLRRFRIADRDQHVAHEARAPDALDRRAGKHSAERRIVESRQLRERRRIQDRRAPSASPARATAANLFHGQTARQSSQP